MANDDPGILGQYGLDLDPQGIADQNRMMGTKMAQIQSQGLGANGFTGALFGNMLAAKNKGMTDDQQARIATTRAAQEGMSKWVNMNPTADANTKQLQYKKLLATAAFQNGLPEVGAQILSDVDRSQLVRDRQQAELKKIGIENDISEATKQDEITKSAIETGKAAYVTAYKIGSRDPNATIAGVFDPKDHSIRTKEGVVPAGMWQMARPDRDPEVRSGAGGAGGDSRVGVAEAGDLRKTALATSDLLDKTLGIDHLLNESFKNGLDPSGMMDATGKTTSFVDRWTNTAQDLARAFSGTGNYGQLSVVKNGVLGQSSINIDDANARAKFTQDHMDEIKAMLPADLPNKAEYAERYASMTTELAYATARAAEPGAKALTEGDFLRGMQTIGGHLNDPTALRKILFTRSMNAVRSLDRRFSIYSEDELKKLVSPEWVNTYKDQRRQVDAAIGIDPETGAPTGASYQQGNRRPAQPGQAPVGQPDKDGWITMPNGAKVRAK